MLLGLIKMYELYKVWTKLKRVGINRFVRKSGTSVDYYEVRLKFSTPSGKLSLLKTQKKSQIIPLNQTN